MPEQLSVIEQERLDAIQCPWCQVDLTYERGYPETRETPVEHAGYCCDVCGAFFTRNPWTEDLEIGD